MFLSVRKLSLALCFSFIFAGCIDFESKYTIDYPADNGTYIGTPVVQPVVNLSGLPALGGTFSFSYDSSPIGEVEVSLNGNQVGQYFTYGQLKAEASYEQLEPFLRQGKNTLSVERLSFGPEVVFYVDFAGPEIIISRGEMAADANSVEIEGYLRDFSGATSLTLKLDQVSGYNADGTLNRVTQDTVSIDIDADGKFCACGADAIDIAGIILSTPIVTSLLYEFEAEDEYGFTAEQSYLADSEFIDTLKVENAVRVAVGDTLVRSLRPVLAGSINQTLSDAPIDVKENAWDDPNICNDVRGVYPGQNIKQQDFDKGDEADGNADGLVDGRQITDGFYNCVETVEPGGDGSTLPLDFNPIDVALLGLNLDAYVRGFYMHDGSAKTVGGESIEGRQGTILLNDFEIKEGNKLGLNLVLTELIADLDIDFLGNIDISMYIGRIIVETDAAVSASDGDVLVQLENSNFVLENILLDELRVLGIPLTGLGNLLIPLLSGLISDLLPSILNPILRDNLQDLRFGGSVFQPESNTHFNAFVFVDEMGTDNLLGPSNPYDLQIGLESLADVVVGDSFVGTSLGPVYFDDPIPPEVIYNSLGETGTNLTVAVNSNFINQALNAVYNIGASHLTFVNSETYYGANDKYPVDLEGDTSVTTASAGDTRLRLWPQVPPSILFSKGLGDVAGRAAVKYNAATIYSDELVKQADDSLVWETQASVEVDFELAVNIDENEGVFTMGAAGPPSFNLHEESYVNNTSLQVPASFLQTLIDAAMFFGGDLLAGQEITLDLNELANDFINGEELKYLSDQDSYSFDLDLNPDACIRYADGGLTVQTPLEAGVTAGSDGLYDVVCEIIQFELSTNTVGVTGDRGTNLYFQMEARDPSIPPAPALPRLDVDNDGLLDYRDNCSPSPLDLVEALDAALNETSLSALLDSEGNLAPADEAALLDALNKLYASRYDASYDFLVGGNLNGTAPADPDAVTFSTTDGDTSAPVSVDIFSYFNSRRLGDSSFASAASLGEYPWLTLIFNNPGQYNGDGDALGELCEGDDDLDGIYTNNIPEGTPAENEYLFVDNCPSVYNPNQANDFVPVSVGDACNVRKQFVVLKNKSNGQCLTKTGEGGSWVSGSNTVTYSACNSNDTTQKFYLKAFNGIDGDDGYELFFDEDRDASRLGAYGKMGITGGCIPSSYSGRVYAESLRTANGNTSEILNQNADVPGGCTGTREADRLDPIFFFDLVGDTSSDGIWFMSSDFEYEFGYPGGREGNFTRYDGCVTSAGDGLREYSEDAACNAANDDERWDIYIGTYEGIWDGTW